MLAKVKRPASMASNISSEFEEVHLEEVDHSTSTGSGEEVEVPSGGISSCPLLLTCIFNRHRNSETRLPQARTVLCAMSLCLDAGDDEVVQKQHPAVVGKNVSAPRPSSTSSPAKAPVAAPEQQAATRKTSAKGVNVNATEGPEPEESEPEISWRGNRTGLLTSSQCHCNVACNERLHMQLGVIASNIKACPEGQCMFVQGPLQIL